MCIRRGNKIRNVMIEAFGTLFSFFRFKACFCSRILFEGVQFTDIHKAAWYKAISNLPENMVQVKDMFEHQTENNEIIVSLWKCPGTAYIRFHKLHGWGCDFSPCFGKHFSG